MTTRTYRSVFVFWLPLAATWLMMSVEGPILAAVIARLADPTYNLAAYGVAFAFAILTEAPVIMLMSASTALVEDAPSLERMRRFAAALNGIASVMLLVALVPSVYSAVAYDLMGLPPEVARITYGSLWIFLPWPAAIGYRRFLQGILIRTNRTRLVAAGTVIRLSAMIVTALLLVALADLPGAWVGAAALSVGVVVEALAARYMAAEALVELAATPPRHPERVPGYRAISHFYLPLALTSLIGLTVQPLLTFFMGRAPSPLESLAVFPVVHALSFMFRSFGLSYQEAAIALLGRHNEHVAMMARFGAVLALATSGALALVAFTPLAGVWFERVSGLAPGLAAYAIVPTRILVPLPALTVSLSLQRAILVQGRRTTPITGATTVEVIGIATLFPLLGFGLGWTGVTAAFTAFLGGRTLSNLVLLRPVSQVLARPLPREARLSEAARPR